MEYPIILLQKKLGEITQLYQTIDDSDAPTQEEWDERISTCNNLAKKMNILNKAIQTLKNVKK